jgi:hypothetical protein
MLQEINVNYYEKIPLAKKVYAALTPEEQNVLQTTEVLKAAIMKRLAEDHGVGYGALRDEIYGWICVGARVDAIEKGMMQ